MEGLNGPLNFFKIKESAPLSAMLPWMSKKKKVVTFKRLLMGRTIQRNQHNFFPNVSVNLSLRVGIWEEKHGWGNFAVVFMKNHIKALLGRISCWWLTDWCPDLWNNHGIMELLWLETNSQGHGVQHLDLVWEQDSNIAFKSLLSQSWWLRWALRSHSTPSLGRVYSAALAWKLDINYRQKT